MKRGTLKNQTSASPPLLQASSTQWAGRIDQYKNSRDVRHARQGAWGGGGVSLALS